MNADEVFLARELELHRRGRVLRQHRGDQIGVLILVLVAEVAAHVAADHADLFRRDAEVTRHVGAAVGDAAGRRVDGELVGVPGRDAHARLHLRVVHERGRVAILEDPIRRREAFLDVPSLCANRHVLVPRVGRQVAFGPDLRGAGLERVLGIEHERQRLVVDRNQLQGLFGRVTIDRGDRRHRLADESHGIVERVPAVLRDLLDLFVVLRAAGNGPGAPEDRAVVVRDDRLHAGHGQRLRRVDPDDARVRMRASQDARVEHAGQLDVAAVGRLACRPLDRVDAMRGVAERREGADGRGRHRRGRARGGTAGGDDRVDVVVVAGAAADVAGHRGPCLFGSGVRRGVQERLCAHQLTRRAVATLRRIVGDEFPLERIVQQAFNGLNGAAIGPQRQLAARIDRFAVEQDRARAALAAVAANLGARQLEMVAQRLDERPSIFDQERALRSVHGQRDGGARRGRGRRRLRSKRGRHRGHRQRGAGALEKLTT